MSDDRAAASGRRLRGPIVLSVLGGVMVVAAAVMWVVASTRVDDVVDETFQGRTGFDGEVGVPGELEVELGPGPRTVYAVVLGGFTATTTTEDVGRDPAPVLDVTVVGPDGEVPVRPVPGGVGYPDLATGALLYRAAELDVSVAGTYTVTVSQAAGSVRADRAGIGPPTDISEAIDEGLESAMLFLLAVLLGLTGMAVLIAGVVWLAVASARAGRPPPGSWPPPPGSWPPPPGAWGPPPPGAWGPPPPGAWGPQPPGAGGPPAGSWPPHPGPPSGRWGPG